MRWLSELPLNLLKLLSALTDLLLYLFLPQVVANRRWPSHAEPWVENRTVRSAYTLWLKPKHRVRNRCHYAWRWIHSPLPNVANQWVSGRLTETILNWVILWLFLVPMLVKIPRGYTVAGYLIFLLLFLWTMGGLLKARSRHVRGEDVDPPADEPTDQQD